MATSKRLPYKIIGDNVVSKLVGVSFDDRPNRIRTLSKGDVIRVAPRPHVKHDQAVIVYSMSADYDIGYLPRELADIVYLNFVDNEHPESVEGTVLEIIGGYAVEVNIGIIIGFTMPSGRS